MRLGVSTFITLAAGAQAERPRLDADPCPAARSTLTLCGPYEPSSTLEHVAGTISTPKNDVLVTYNNPIMPPAPLAPSLPAFLLQVTPRTQTLAPPPLVARICCPLPSHRKRHRSCDHLPMSTRLSFKRRRTAASLALLYASTQADRCLGSLCLATHASLARLALRYVPQTLCAALIQTSTRRRQSPCQ